MPTDQTLGADAETGPYRIVILLPIHALERRGKTGDYYYGQSLAAALRRLGHEVRCLTQIERDQIDPGEIAIIIRGRVPFREKRARLNIAWNISRPPRYRDNDFGFADILLAASDSMADRARNMRGSPPVEVMYQAFDQSIMYPDETQSGDHLIFVGTPRDEALRPVVRYAAESGLPFQLWGNGWEDTPFKAFQVGGNIPNTELGALYRASGAVINDHLPHMRANNVTSNRVFDGIACGRPVVSDIATGFPSEIAPMVFPYSDSDTFRAAAERALEAAKTHRTRFREIADGVTAQHSFDARAKRLVQIIQTCLASGDLKPLSVEPQDS